MKRIINSTAAVFMFLSFIFLNVGSIGAFQNSALTFADLIVCQIGGFASTGAFLRLFAATSEPEEGGDVDVHG